MAGVVIPLLVIIAVILLVVLIWVFSVNSAPKGGQFSINVSDMTQNFYSYPPVLWFSSSWIEFNIALGNNPYHYTVADSNGKVVYGNRTPQDNIPNLANINILGESIQAYNKPGGSALIRYQMREFAIIAVMDGVVRLVHIEAGLLT